MDAFSFVFGILVGAGCTFVAFTMGLFFWALRESRRRGGQWVLGVRAIEDKD